MRPVQIWLAVSAGSLLACLVLGAMGHPADILGWLALPGYLYVVTTPTS
jgi:hypothetical protein